MKDASESWTSLGKSDEIVEGTGKEFLVGTRIVAVFRFEGALFALDGICPHQGGPLAQGHLSGGCVTCPWHGWQYQLATGEHTISGRALAETFPVREREGMIEVLVAQET
ncbi:MAG: Rieske (2Fe-2S) protein [Pirellulaceae bacterium]